MAKKTTTKDPSAAHVRALKRANTRTNRIADSISGGGVRSLADTLIRSRSIDPKVAEAAFDAVQSALDEARERYTEAQAASDGDVELVARVDLTSL